MKYLYEDTFSTNFDKLRKYQTKKRDKYNIF